MLGLLMASYEMNTFGRDYQRQVLDNSKAFARAMADLGINVQGDPSVGYSETHQVLLRVGYAKGVDMAHRLERQNIVANFQALPDDEGFTSASGVRMGVQEMTRFGMKEDDFEKLAGLVADVVLRNAGVKENVTKFRQGFLDMKYCFPEAEGKELLGQLMGEIR
jgi:glycine/serine hydroxymethyltransferase